MQVAIIILSNNPKSFLEFCDQLEYHSVEDKVILISRSESDNFEIILQRINYIKARGLFKI